MLHGIDFLYFRGRVGLHAALRALGVGRGDEVALQAFTCVAVAEGVMATRARPLFIDIEAGGVNMSADDLRKKITPNTRAVVVQHTFGIPADMGPILEVAGQAGLPVIEDCCHTLRSTYRGKQVGAFGAAAFYSFEWGKPIVAGLGGGLVANDPALRERIEGMQGDYQEPSGRIEWKIRFQFLAYHTLYRPSLYWFVRSLYHTVSGLGLVVGSYNPVREEGPLPADFSRTIARSCKRRLAARLPSVDDLAATTAKVTAEYDAGIPTAGFHRPIAPPDSNTVLARYPLLVENKSELLERARRARVELASWYGTPVHPLPRESWPQVHYVAGSCPNAEAAAARIVSLPTHSRVRPADIARATALFQRGNQ
jgi:dTDP-4-amino-4,6-dideoxygalactose transaminase